MKMLIAQPKQESDLSQFKKEIAENPQVDLILYPEGYCVSKDLPTISELAAEFKTTVVTGYRDEQNLDRALIINSSGEIILDRAKTPDNVALYHPSTVQNDLNKFGYLLCREIFIGEQGLQEEQDIEFLFNPIGVGMFSEEQYADWTGEAQKLSKQHNAFVIGTSHADGSYRNCGFSIPVAFVYDKNGEVILLSHNDTRTRILDTVEKTVKFITETSLVNK